MKKTYLKFFRVITLVENAVCALGLILTTFATVIQVLNRYWLHYEIMWLADMTLYIFLSTLFFMMATTTREESHTSVDILEAHAFKGPLLKPVYKICSGLCSLAIIITVLPIFYAYLLRAIKFPEYSTLVRWFNTSWLIELMFGMLILSIFHTLHNVGLQVLAFKAALVGRKAEKEVSK